MYVCGQGYIHVSFPHLAVYVAIGRSVYVIPLVWLCYDQQALGVQFHVSYGVCGKVSTVFVVSALIGIHDTMFL